MSFDLRIQFVGLMLFVPEDGKRLHVLMPFHEGHENHGGAAAPGAGHPGHPGGGAGKPSRDRHYARLVWDRAHEDEKSQQMSRQLMFVTLERRVLEVIDLVKTPDLDSDLPDEIPHMSRVAGEVEHKWVREFPAGALLSRATFDTGALTHCENGAPFYLGDATTRMTSRTEWTIRGIEGESLDLGALISDESGAHPDLPPLHPIGQTITLTVYNALAGDMPRLGGHGPVADDNARHFVAYYDLCTRPGERPVPRALLKAEEILVFGDHVVVDEHQSGTGLTCVQAQAKLAAASA